MTLIVDFRACGQQDDHCREVCPAISQRSAEFDRRGERDGVVEELGVPADQPELLSDFRGFTLAASSFGKNAGKISGAGL